MRCVCLTLLVSRCVLRAIKLVDTTDPDIVFIFRGLSPASAAAHKQRWRFVARVR
jgi:hypothetical protein